MELRDVLRAAISKGAPLYNRGDIEGCAQLYEEAAETAISAGASKSEQQR
eukprot:CAMPEP_0179469752 /NCGR_PEP_ID=MMETSP0799-20121207/50357_1 /TAXON_ID=46947 /ORGANISM="Geminigera cryophila, Strain CCMP2564" /LENGTH=49 /DNA_ID= /DNA_START= /DNA_END= /DNA_ORIENTATION=